MVRNTAGLRADLLSLLQYMDRIYVKAHNKTSVGQLGLDLWCQHVVRRPSIQTRMTSILLDMIQRERAGEVVARSLVREVTQVALQHYTRSQSLDADLHNCLLWLRACFDRLSNPGLAAMTWV